MYEVSIALKYLVPRLRNLSVSIISIISVLVIATVVWLTVIFFSVTEGLEKRWTEKLVAITAPVRLLPTDEYYRSFYVQIDSMSEASNYELKGLKEKLESKKTNPYDPTIDPALPADFPRPLVNKNGELVDILQQARNAALQVKGASDLSVSVFETAFANVKLRLVRRNPYLPSEDSSTRLLSQASYLINFDPSKVLFEQAILPLRSEDLENVLQTIDDTGGAGDEPNAKAFSSMLKSFLDRVQIQELITGEFGCIIPQTFFPEGGKCQVLAQFSEYFQPQVLLATSKERLKTLLAEKKAGSNWLLGTLYKKNGKLYFSQNGADKALEKVTLLIDSYQKLVSTIGTDLTSVHASKQIPFKISFNAQGVPITGTLLKGDLQIASFSLEPKAGSQPLWLERLGKEFVLPKNPFLGEGVLLPKSFRESDVRIGDQGQFNYYAPGATSLSEQKIGFFVAGFYDPGIIPIGGKLILARDEVVSLIQSAALSEENLSLSGLNVNFSNYKQASAIKKEIERKLKEQGVAQFFEVKTYDEYDFTKDIFQQLKSERNLFSLISVIIVIVACSNIVSMLIILVHNKQKELAVLRALGSSKLSIGCIFGLSGFLMGICGSILGLSLAYVTVKNMSSLLAFLGKLQGFDVLNAAFYGESVPTEVSVSAMILVITSTAIISTLAGSIAAFKASRQNTSDALRAE